MKIFIKNENKKRNKYLNYEINICCFYVCCNNFIGIGLVILIWSVWMILRFENLCVEMY